jgi:hypothetical protein
MQDMLSLMSDHQSTPLYMTNGSSGGSLVLLVRRRIKQLLHIVAPGLTRC